MSEPIRGSVAGRIGGAALFLVLSLACGAAGAVEEGLAKANFSHEVADCTAYYTWSEGYAEKQNHPEEAAVFGESKDWSFGILMMLRPQPSELQKIKVEVSQSLQRLRAVADSEGAERLPDLYETPCKDLLKYPEKRYKYWTDKQD